MLRLKAALTMLMLIAAVKAWAECWTYTDIKPDGSIKTCQVCCFAGGCTRTCM
jgi:hypothetical protein